MNAGVWGGVSVALDLTSFIPFIWAALTGPARPSRISWSMWAAEYWVLFMSEVTYGSGLASVWIAGGEAAGSTTLAAIGWLQYRARRNPPSHADDDPPRWLTLSMTAGVTTALAAWELSTRFTAIILAVAVDIMAASVSTYKTYRHPAGESMLSWWLFLAATVAALLAVGRAPPILYAYPGTGALTAIAVITAWASGGPDHRSRRPTGVKNGAGHRAPNANRTRSQRSQQVNELTRDQATGARPDTRIVSGQVPD